MKRQINIIVAFLFFSLLFFIACNQGGKGFALPEGDVEHGKMVFKEMACNSCHSTSDIEWIDAGEEVNITLGGEVKILKSYEELVTSVINPQHKIAKVYEKRAQEEGATEMMNYNDFMSVADLVDLVTYLQQEYKIKTPATYNRYY